MTNKAQILQCVILMNIVNKVMSMGKTGDRNSVFVSEVASGDVVDVELKKYKYSEKRTDPVCKHFRIYKDFLMAIPRICRATAIQKKRSARKLMTYQRLGSTSLVLLIIVRGEALGFHLMMQSWEKMLDLEECQSQAAPSKEIPLVVKKYVIKQRWAFYDLKLQERFLRIFLIQISSIGKVLFLIQFFSYDESKRRAIFKFLQKFFPQITSLLYTINDNGNDSKKAYALYKLSQGFAALSRTDIVYDLYTGIRTSHNNSSLLQSHKVIGLESVPETTALAEENAINNFPFFCGDIKTKPHPRFFRNTGQKPEVVIYGPSPDGMHEKFIEMLLQIKTQRNNLRQLKFHHASRRFYPNEGTLYPVKSTTSVHVSL